MDQIREVVLDHHVGHYGQSAAAGPLDQTYRLVEIGLGARSHHHVRSGLGQSDRAAATDAGPAAGDDGDLVGDPKIIQNHYRALASFGAGRPAIIGKSR
jgi:hypothetical protein